ncbi:DinB family protein [Paenibacillus spongiae]|uniref:DinB family protein n=1 Tax=Paenibacillus spongiae TaxID=2909671 RepID=A0ABY5SCF0_9BACL|nr:DinB family protein [Paenibacillus spongiae]UVI30195.1 DinB family protein [Paenibacillus spongiae]
MNTRPEPDEYLPAAERYIQLVPNGNLIEIMRSQLAQSLYMLKDLSDEQAMYRYAEGKWSLKTVVGHIADVERLWNYRILRIARGDARELAGYDRDTFAELAPFEHLSLAEVLHDLSAVRESTLTLIGHLEEEALLRRGEFNGHPLSARAAAFVIAGHERHHMNVIKTKYLSL